MNRRAGSSSEAEEEDEVTVQRSCVNQKQKTKRRSRLPRKSPAHNVWRGRESEFIKQVGVSMFKHIRDHGLLESQIFAAHPGVTPGSLDHIITHCWLQHPPCPRTVLAKSLPLDPPAHFLTLDQRKTSSHLFPSLCYRFSRAGDITEPGVSGMMLLQLFTRLSQRPGLAKSHIHILFISCIHSLPILDKWK